MIYTMDEIVRFVKPVAEKYGLRAVYLFGSYARGEATADSDIDLLIDRTDSHIRGLWDMGSLYDDLQSSCGKEIDIVTTHILEQSGTCARLPRFVEALRRERVQIYGRP